MGKFLKKLDLSAKIASSIGLITLLGLGLGLLILLKGDWSDINLIHLIIGSLLLFVVLEGVLVYFGIRWFVNRPLSYIIDAMKMAQGGNLNIRCPIEDSDGLVSETAREFDRLMSSLNALDRFRPPRTKGPLEPIYVGDELDEPTEITSRQKQDTETLKDLKVIYRISQDLSQALELSELIHTATRTLSETLAYRCFSLIFLNEERRLFEVRVAHGFHNDMKLLGLVIPEGSGLSGRAILSRKRLFRRHLAREEDYLHEPYEVKEKLYFMSLPMIVKDQVVGVLNIGDEHKEFFNADHIEFLESLASHMATAYHRSQLYLKTKELAITDELTGLNNRRHFLRMLQIEWRRAIRFNQPLSLLMVDVDHFKRVNDRYGHLNGDQVLKKMAQLLMGHVREVDTVARFGGEEFVIILTDTPYHDALMVAEKLRRITEEKSRFICDQLGIDLQLSVSIGVSNYPRCGDSADELLNTADIALYDAKNKGRNRVEGYAKDIHLVPITNLHDRKTNVGE